MSTPADRTTAATAPPTASRHKFDPDHPDEKIIRQCRSLTIKGVQCRSSAVRAQDFCVRHRDRSRITFSTGGHVTVPLLEDFSAIQLMLTKTMHGLFNGDLTPDIAGKAIYCCNVAASTLPRPPRQKPSDKPEPLEEPVVDLDTDSAGNLIGPRQEYRGPTGIFEPHWSFSKYMYEQQCEELGIPKPTCAADYPAYGWLTEDEMKEDPDLFTARYQEKLRAARAERDRLRAQETAAAHAAGLPDPWAHLQRKNPDCPFDTEWCDGPHHTHHCCYCAGQLEMDPSDPRYPGDEVLAQLKSFWNGDEEEQAAASPNKVDLKASAAPAPFLSPVLGALTFVVRNAERRAPNAALSRVPHIPAVGDVGFHRTPPATKAFAFLNAERRTLNAAFPNAERRTLKAAFPNAERGTPNAVLPNVESVNTPGGDNILDTQRGLE